LFSLNTRLTTHHEMFNMTLEQGGNFKRIISVIPGLQDLGRKRCG